MSEKPSGDPEQNAYRALEELLKRIKLTRATGTFYLRLDSKMGGITGMKIGGEETFQPKNA